MLIYSFLRLCTTDPSPNPDLVKKKKKKKLVKSFLTYDDQKRLTQDL